MELYEIVKFTHKPIKGEEYFEPEVITATMDKEIAEKMLLIYKGNQNMNEAYHIRTLREPEVAQFISSPVQCLYCNSYSRCVDTIKTRPNELIRCIRFGELQRYIRKDMN